MRILLDAQLPWRLIPRFAECGHEASHVADHMEVDARDFEVAKLANHLQAVLMSKDGDFVEMSQRDVLKVPLIWIRSGNMTTNRLWSLIGPALDDVERALAEGKRVIEVGGPVVPKKQDS